MELFQVDRTQHPIGQGGFHSMALHSHGTRRFSMVVDCGGSRKEHRALLAKAFAERESRHDFLVISHLDNDHINGLVDLKQAGVEFQTVFLPHVEIDSYIKWMTLKLSGGRSSGIAIAGFATTATLLYGGHFGPVVLVGDPGVGDNVQTDTYPPEGKGESEVLSDATRKIVATAKLATGAGLSCSTSLTFNLDWLIRFYSREWKFPKEIDAIWKLKLLKNLSGVINSANVDLTPSAWELFADDLNTELEKKADPSLSAEPASLVATTDPRYPALVKLGVKVATGKMSCKKLLSILYSIASRLHDYNDASMCVYSGPAERGIGVRRRRFQRSVHSRGSTASPRSNTPNRAAGWIHTGDANFTDKSRLKDFLDHFIMEASLTSVLVLPHHGSRLSFDRHMDRLRGLAARLAEPTVFVAPADPHGRYHHPDGDVVHACHMLGNLAIVNEDADSYYSESVTTVPLWNPYWAG